MVQFFKPQPRAINKKHQEILITRTDHQGVGIGQLGKLTTFVSGLLPHEKALVQITQQKKNYAKAKVIKRLSDSDKRIAPVCSYFEKCGGCSLQHISHSDQLSLKEDGLLALLNRAVPSLDLNEMKTTLLNPIISHQPYAYRRSARLSIFQGKIGFREAASKNIIDINSCPVLAPQLNALLPNLKERLHKIHSPLGHVELVQADNGILIFLRANKKLKEIEKTEFIQWCQEQSINAYLMEADNKIQHLCGQAPYYLIQGIPIYFMPNDFIQVNAQINKKMVDQALDWLDLCPEDRVLDLFCGLGNFSLPLAQKVQQVTAIEGVDAMVCRATDNAKKNNIDNIVFYQANLEENITKKSWAQEGFNKILLDPARSGALEVMSHIVKLAPERVVYVSCNPVTLARDTKLLVENGFRLQKIGILDMFPQTGHVESMLLFIR